MHDFKRGIWTSLGSSPLRAVRDLVRNASIQTPVFSLVQSLKRLARLSDPRYWRNCVAPSAEIGSAALEWACLVGPWAVMRGNVSVGAFTLIGRYNTLAGGEIAIGRYCQIGPNAGIYAVNHPYDCPTMYNGPGIGQGALAGHAIDRRVEIGHDVWIGHGAMILAGVTIGTGAVIGAGSVVTRAVPPYAVAAGNPAKVIRYRFSPEKIAALIDSQWWNQHPQELAKNVGLLRRPVEELTLLEIGCLRPGEERPDSLAV